MLQITPQHRLLFSIEPADFRSGIDGLAAVCRKKLATDPFTGTVFIFTNKKRTAVKLLVYDGTGFWLCQKRFSAGKLKWWPSTAQQATDLRSIELVIMLQQGNPRAENVPDDWRRLSHSLP